MDVSFLSFKINLLMIRVAVEDEMFQLRTKVSLKK